ncbi:MAG: hypothetical protein EOL95_09045 [Bacteroidia bacterium]|nr:hypothetical protein [Bacteroidia bacterium]
MKSFREVTNAQGGYLEVIFKLQDRDYTLNIFPGKGETAGRQVNYVTGAIRKQLGKEEESLSLLEVLEIAKTNPINIWFSYSQEYGRMNVNFHEPVVIGETDLDSVDA